MADSCNAVDAALREADKLKTLLQKGDGKQIRGSEEQGLMKATAYAWFRNHRPDLLGVFSEEELSDTDAHYRHVLESGERQSSRPAAITRVKTLRNALVQLRSEAMMRSGRRAADDTSDAPPDFSPLVADTNMQAILNRRWKEIQACLAGPAPLAATVMMGGLLEGLLLARINRETKKAAVFTAKSAPRDKNNSTLHLGEWTLRNYIDVSHELKWITRSAKDVGEVLRDYRNYIHPQKELTHGVELSPEDARILWEIAKTLSRQVITSTAQH